MKHIYSVAAVLACLLSASPARAQNGASAPPAASVTDTNGAVWTVGSDGVIYRNGTHAGGGYGSVVYLADGVIYVLGGDTWYRWTGESYWTEYGKTKPSFTPPTPKPPEPVKPVIGPKMTLFTHSDADFAKTDTYVMDVFQCASVGSDGTCQGQAAQPFRPGIVIPKTAVTTPNPPVAGSNRQFDLVTAPVNGIINTFPFGTPFVVTLTATGPTGQSPASASSNVFQSEEPVCQPPGQPVALGALTLLHVPITLKAGGSGWVLFDIATQRAVTVIEAQLGPTVVSHLPVDADLRTGGIGLRFTAPAAAGTYPFKIKLTDIVRCTYESALRDIVVTP